MQKLTENSTITLGLAAAVITVVWILALMFGGFSSRLEAADKVNQMIQERQDRQGDAMKEQRELLHAIDKQVIGLNGKVDVILERTNK